MGKVTDGPATAPLTAAPVRCGLPGMQVPLMLL